MCSLRLKATERGQNKESFESPDFYRHNTGWKQIKVCSAINVGYSYERKMSWERNEGPGMHPKAAESVSQVVGLSLHRGTGNMVLLDFRIARDRRFFFWIGESISVILNLFDHHMFALWSQITWLFCSQIRLGETTLEELHPSCLIYLWPDLDVKNLELEPEIEAFQWGFWSLRREWLYFADCEIWNLVAQQWTWHILFPEDGHQMYPTQNVFLKWALRLSHQEMQSKYVPHGPVAKTPNSQWGDPGSIPGCSTRPHMPQLRVPMLQLKIPHAITKPNL